MAKKIAKSAKGPTQEQQVQIPPIEIAQFRITLVGDSPLLVNRFDEKSQREMTDKAEKKARNKREFGSAEEQMEKSLYPIPGKKGKYGIPVAGIKNCAVSAARFVDGIAMTTATGAFHIGGDVGGLIELNASNPQLDERVVRVGNFPNKKPCVRYRGRFDQWSVTFPVRYNKSVLSAEQIVNLFENAGFAVGLCEYRPEKKGNLGMFSVKRG